MQEKQVPVVNLGACYGLGRGQWRGRPAARRANPKLDLRLALSPRLNRDWGKETLRSRGSPPF